MQKLIYAFGAAGVAFLIQAAAVKPAAAYIAYPWCAYYGGSDIGGAASCGSSTFEQCLATVSGMGGFCARNRYYIEPAQQSAPPRRHRRTRE